MGIAMGAPWFQIKHLESSGLVGLSANFPLYGDMSERMMRIISQFAPVFDFSVTDMPTTTGLCGKKEKPKVIPLTGTSSWWCRLSGLLVTMPHVRTIKAINKKQKCWNPN